MNGRLPLYIILTFACLAWETSQGGTAGTVETLGERLEGETNVENGHVRIRDRRIPLDQIVWMAQDGKPGVGLLASRVHLTSEESWAVELLRFSGRTLRFRSPFLGEKDLPQSMLQRIDFGPRLAPDASFEPGNLYREKGEPIPGALLWLDERQLAMESPLGGLSLSRDKAWCYVFASASPPPRRDGAELRLSDGSIFRGALALGQDSVILEHRVLGQCSFPVAVVRAFLRRDPRWTFLSDLTPAKVEEVPLVASKLPSASFQQPIEQVFFLGEHLCAWGLRLSPAVALRFSLPQQTGKTRCLRTLLGPAPGSRGDVRVRIAVDAHAVFDREITASDPALPLSLTLPAGQQLSLEVQYGKKLLFPCEVIFGDAFLVFE